MQLICETLLPPRMSVTIIFWTLSSYTLQSIVIITTAIFIPIYLFFLQVSHVTACLVWWAVKLSISRPPKFGCITRQISIGYISAILEMDILPVFSIIICSSQATKLFITRSSISKFHTLSIKCAQNPSITFIFSTTLWNFVTKFSHKISTSV